MAVKKGDVSPSLPITVVLCLPSFPAKLQLLPPVGSVPIQDPALRGQVPAAQPGLSHPLPLQLHSPVSPAPLLPISAPLPRLGLGSGTGRGGGGRSTGRRWEEVLTCLLPLQPGPLPAQDERPQRGGRGGAVGLRLLCLFRPENPARLQGGGGRRAQVSAAMGAMWGGGRSGLERQLSSWRLHCKRPWIVPKQVPPQLSMHFPCSFLDLD